MFHLKLEEKNNIYLYELRENSEKTYTSTEMKRSRSQPMSSLRFRSGEKGTEGERVWGWKEATTSLHLKQLTSLSVWKHLSSDINNIYCAGWPFLNTEEVRSILSKIYFFSPSNPSRLFFSGAQVHSWALCFQRYHVIPSPGYYLHFPSERRSVFTNNAALSPRSQPKHVLLRHHSGSMERQRHTVLFFINWWPAWKPDVHQNEIWKKFKSPLKHASCTVWFSDGPQNSFRHLQLLETRETAKPQKSMEEQKARNKIFFDESH